MSRDLKSGLVVENVLIDDLLEDPDNARTHGQANIDAIKKSLEKFGQVEPLVVQKSSNRVIGGNGRLAVMRSLLWQYVDIVRIDVTDLHAKALGVALNRSAELAGWDEGILAETMAQINIEESDLIDITGYSEKELDDLLSPNIDDVGEDEPPEPPAEPTTKLGDVWILGEHTLVCGDCATVAFPSYDLLITDPPYGVSYAAKNEFLNTRDTGKRNQSEIAGDHMTPDGMSNLWTACFSNLRQTAKPGASYYVTGPQIGDLLPLLMQALTDSDFPLRHMLVWAKNNHVLGRADYNYKHEPILFGWVKGAHTFAGQGEFKTSLWEVPKPQSSKEHPTMKPVRLFANAIANSSRRGDLVVDPFLGSGTTLVAAEQLGRRCFGVELEPKYCDVIVERWQNLTGKKAKRDKTK